VLALALNQRLTGRAGYRIVFYLPAIVTSIAVATMWSWMYDPTLGVVNAIGEELGLGFLVQDWLGSPNLALFSVFAASAWTAAGPNMILFLAGLQGIRQDLVEAARVDGANRLQVFRNVIVPSLRTTFIIVIALTIINSLKAFDLVYAMTFGGPAHRSQVLASWTYFLTFSERNWGQGMAVAMVLLAITLVVIMPYLRYVFREED
jgi:raffinose/stachyose/melibiose transport system permease protein